MLLDIYKLFGNTKEFWEFIMRNRLKLTEEQFTFAIHGLRVVNDKLTNAARMVLVEGKDPSEAATVFEVERSNVSNKVSRILENLSEQLDEHGMCYKSTIIDSDLIPVADALERKSLEKLQLSRTKSRKRN